MTVSKITTAPTPNETIGKINEIIDNLGGTATDVQINGTSITSNNVANIVTNTAYNSSSNKLATMADIPTIATSVSSSSTNSETVGAKLFYDTVGDIESALNTINSGSSS